MRGDLPGLVPIDFCVFAEPLRDKGVLCKGADCLIHKLVAAAELFLENIPGQAHAGSALFVQCLQSVFRYLNAFFCEILRPGGQDDLVLDKLFFLAVEAARDPVDLDRHAVKTALNVHRKFIVLIEMDDAHAVHQQDAFLRISPFLSDIVDCLDIIQRPCRERLVLSDVVDKAHLDVFAAGLRDDLCLVNTGDMFVFTINDLSGFLAVFVIQRFGEAQRLAGLELSLQIKLDRRGGRRQGDVLKPGELARLVAQGPVRVVARIFMIGHFECLRPPPVLVRLPEIVFSVLFLNGHVGVVHGVAQFLGGHL